jgi:hypothetical protein
MYNTKNLRTAWKEVGAAMHKNARPRPLVPKHGQLYMPPRNFITNADVTRHTKRLKKAAAIK